MKRVILSLFLVLALTACGTSQVAELRTVETTTITESNIEKSEVVETTLEETTEEEATFEETTEEETTVEETTKPDKWTDYSDEVREIIAKAEGKDYATSKTLTKEERNKIHSVGLYMITKDVTQVRNNDTSEVFSSGGSTEFLTRDDLVDFLTSKYGKFRNEKLGFEALNFAIWDS